MSVPVAYATIIIIWSTTPLGIAWSGESLSPISAIAIRMLLAAAIGYVVLKGIKVPLAWTKAARNTYAYSLLGVYAAMLCTYYAAYYVPSGLISVLYALSPVLSNIFSYILIGRVEFSRARWLAFAVSFSGLLFIFLDDWVVQGEGWFGLLLLLIAVCLYSVSGVLVQREKYDGHPLSITVGTLLMSVPLFVVTWLLLDGDVPVIDWSTRSPWAVLYLAIAGSLLGFACYFFIIKQLGATAVAMVTLMTPVLALSLGNLLNGEAVTIEMMGGTAGILTGLVLYYRSSSPAKAAPKPISEGAYLDKTGAIQK